MKDTAEYLFNCCRSVRNLSLQTSKYDVSYFCHHCVAYFGIFVFFSHRTIFAKLLFCRFIECCNSCIWTSFFHIFLFNFCFITFTTLCTTITLEAAFSGAHKPQAHHCVLILDYSLYSPSKEEIKLVTNNIKFILFSLKTPKPTTQSSGWMTRAVLMNLVNSLSFDR